MRHVVAFLALPVLLLTVLQVLNNNPITLLSFLEQQAGLVLPVSDDNNTVLTATSSSSVVRAAVMYFPMNTPWNTHFIHQARWFLRSWQEMSKYQDANIRTDVLFVVTSKSVTQVAQALERWNCVTTIRTNRQEPSACRLIGDYIPMEERQEDVLHTYRFANSIECILHLGKMNAVSCYDKLLRTDMDVFLTPKFATWIIPNDDDRFIVGVGAFCFPQYDTCNRLHRIADEMGLSPPKGTEVVDSVGSTWYGDPRTMLECAKLSTDVMRYMFRNHFTEQERMPGNKGWPHWHFGVLSMYAGNIAINHCALQNGFERRPDMIDFHSSSEESVFEHAHVHTWHERRPFSKFVFEEGGYKDVEKDKLNLTIIRDYAMYMALDANTD